MVCLQDSTKTLTLADAVAMYRIIRIHLIKRGSGHVSFPVVDDAVAKYGKLRGKIDERTELDVTERFWVWDGKPLSSGLGKGLRTVAAVLGEEIDD